MPTPTTPARHGAISRSFLLVPAGDQPKRFDQARESSTDAVIVNFGDTVAPERIGTLMRARTEPGQDSSPAGIKAATAALPRGHAPTVPEVADLFVHLASDRSRCTSGVIFTVDGRHGLAEVRRLKRAWAAATSRVS